MKAARLVRPVNSKIPGPLQGLYECDPPIEGHTVVVVSAIEGETLAFPADASGTITDWCELQVSQYSPMTAAQMFRLAGYSMI